MRILIADDHALFRDGLRSLLEARGDDVVAEARDGDEAIALVRLHRPDIVLMDLMMPNIDGLAATRLISAELPDVRVVVLTASEDDADLFQAVKSGARGYLPKDLEARELFAFLDGVIKDEPALTPALARKVLGEFARNRTEPATPPGPALTDREREVLELLTEGVTSNRELADRLFVSENTVKYHLRNILDKLHLSNRAQVIAYALRHR
ncbi:MAG TPA: response regulator transcription factor, partial [Thermomicrobiales bacterium]|nr:response regulator transcription factor [Thermomicrobiales bacterium]